MMESIQEEIISRMKTLIVDLTQRVTETDRETCTNMQKIIKQDLDDILSLHIYFGVLSLNL